ncbi:MAG: HlyD family efflux transporter periplasmic adaptor subunit [Catonella sp.]|uniref:HlyD family efflux transporter periplasmic adaptor subunit n=1 Tax=Catonella sp. TaxID=2382125 RepID=UPI003F9F5DF5
MAEPKSLKAKSNNIVRYGEKKKNKEKKRFNVSGIIFLMIVAYILGHTFMFLTREKTSIYRVISDERNEVVNTSGLILRNEKVFTVSDTGYINYYINGNSRVHKNEAVFSIDKIGNIYSKLTLDDQTDEAGERLMGILHQFQINRDDNFMAVYNLKESMAEMVMTTSGKKVIASLKKITDENEFFNVNYASDSGIIIYGTDGLEGLSETSINPEIFQKQNDYVLKIAAENDGKVDAGEPVYKLISDETWKIVVPITENQKKLLEGKDYLDIVIDNKGFTAKAQSKIERINNNDYLILTLFNYMVDYSEKRFVNVYIILKSMNGLKIPKSSMVERMAYEIPEEYYTSGTGNVSGGFSLQTVDKNNKVIKKNVEVDICYKDADNKVVYVDIDEIFKAGDEIIEREGNNKFKIGKTRLLKGVYNVNNGYPRFKHVEPDIEDRASADSDYYLIPMNKGYYLNEYDNIILNADKLEMEKNNS